MKIDYYGSNITLSEELKYSKVHLQIYAEYRTSLENDTITRYYFSHSPDVPKDFVFYDYFGNHEIYYDFNVSPQIEGLSYLKLFAKMFFNTQYIKEHNKPSLTKDQILNIDLSTFSSDPKDLSLSNIMIYGDSPIDPFTKGYYIPAKYIFELSSQVENLEENKIVQVPPPLCKSYSFFSSDKEKGLSIKSSSYNFANKVYDTNICTNKDIVNAVNEEYSDCAFMVHNRQSLCLYFDPLVNIIKDHVVSSDYSSSSHKVYLVHYLTSGHDDVFQIKTDDSVLYNIYNSDKTYEELLDLAQEMFDSYIEDYSTYSFQEVEQVKSEETPKTTYISTLLEV